MGTTRNSNKHLRDPLYDKDFGKCVLDSLFHGWYKIRYYHLEATLKERLSRKLAAINKEILYLHDQTDERSIKPPRPNDKRKYWEKVRDASELEKKKQQIITQLRDINRDERKRRPNT